LADTTVKRVGRHAEGEIGLLPAPENQAILMSLSGIPLLVTVLRLHIEDERIVDAVLALGRMCFNPEYLERSTKGPSGSGSARICT
jgi:hypothetical protein